MLISDLDHFQALDTVEITGGANSDLLSFSIFNGVLTLKLGETVLLERPTGLAKHLALSSKDTAFLMSSVTSKTVNGVTTTSYSLIGSPAAKPWKIFRLKYAEEPN